MADTNDNNEETEIEVDEKTLDVARRVFDFMWEHGYQDFNYDCADEYDGGEIDVCIDDDGWNRISWSDADDFLFGKNIIFVLIDRYDDHGNQFYKAFSDNLEALAKVKGGTAEEIEQLLDKELKASQIEKLRVDYLHAKNKCDWIRDELIELGVDPASL